MKHTQKCWYNITDTTISNCYQNSEIISPYRSNGPIIPAKLHHISNINLGEDLIINHASQKDLDQDLGKLVFMKIVHQKDVMSISKLLNPSQNHASGLEVWTTEKIFQEIQPNNNHVHMPAPDTTKNIKYAEQISTMFPIQKM